MKNQDLTFLKERLKGPIIPEIIDPNDYDRDDILKSYFQLILFLAARYTRPTIDFEDVVVEGIMGLLDAIKRFDINKAKGNPKAFHNLAIVRIRSHMFEYFLKNSTQINIPNNIARGMNLLEQIRNVVKAQEYEGNSDHAIFNYDSPEFDSILPEEVRDRLHRVKGKMNNLAINCDRSYEQMVEQITKIEYDINNLESEEIYEISPEEIASSREFLDKVLANLNSSARKVIEKLLEGKTLEEVGRETGVTRERARQIKEATLKYLHDTPMYKEAMK